MVVISTLVFLTAVFVYTTAQDTPSQPTNARQVEKKILDDILGSEAYDPRIRPSGTNSTGEFLNVRYATPCHALFYFTLSLANPFLFSV